MTRAYLLGALHDSTKRKYTYRISQKSEDYVTFIADSIKNLGGNAWTYREGKSRNVYIVEFARRFLSGTTIESYQDKSDYVRGYFDTDGGIAKQSSVRYYLYFAQKNLKDLEQVKDYLIDLGIACGKIHNPSKRQDAYYWRFYIAAKSYNDFAKMIGSWHPEKKLYLRMKI
jgi:hypothetical protein